VHSNFGCRSIFWRISFVRILCLSLVVQPDRTCEVSVRAERMFLSSSIHPSGENIICGSRRRPWLLEAPSGQRVNISLLDLTGSSSSTSSAHRARTVETASSSGCRRQFGFIEDKSANRNINICADAAHRQPTLYVSQSNAVAVVTESATERQDEMNNFLIGFTGIVVYLLFIYSCLLFKARVVSFYMNMHF